MNAAFVLALICAVTDWYAVARQNRTLEYVFKPATLTALILAALLLLNAPHDAWQAQWFLPGLVFSLLGDIFLMLPNPRWFVPGLASFLLTHVFYVIGLNPTLPSAGSIVILVVCAVVVGAVVWRVVGALRAAKRDALVAPVIAYGVAMTLMLFSAYGTLLRADWSTPRRALVIGGATLFFVSDTMIAWHRFVKPFGAAPLAIAVTYHVGQLALVLSIASALL